MKMLKKHILILLLFLSIGLSGRAPSQAQLPGQAAGDIEPFSKDDRVLILAPHPDDESIGCAGAILAALRAGAKVHVAYLTNGDHNQWAFIVYEKRITLRQGEFIHMGEVRREEAVKAMQLLGLRESDLTFMGYPDFGTFKIFTRVWDSDKPYKGLLTRVSAVPYKDNLSFGAPYTGESILADLKIVLLSFRPNKVFVSHPADVNGDHKTFYLFLQVALNDLTLSLPHPKVYPYLIHHSGWPLPRHYHPELKIEPPAKLAPSDIHWVSLPLSAEDVEKKRQAILCYRSQTSTSAFYLLAFARGNELFGDYPAVELKRQASLKEQGAQFFGFSSMFSEKEMPSLLDTPEILARDSQGKVSYAVLDNDFLIRLQRGEKIGKGFNGVIYLFPYSDKKPFARMPKLTIVFKGNKCKVFDKGKLVKPQRVGLELDANELTLRIPLEALGEPSCVFSSVRARGTALPFEAVGYRRIEIK